MKLWKEVMRSVCVLLMFMLILGVAYPLFITLIGKTVFPRQVEGSLRYDDKGQVLGSHLIGQASAGAQYFSARPSAVSYETLPSSGSNLGPTNPHLLKNFQTHLAELQKDNPKGGDVIPIVLLTASASGLDPDISVAAALYQAPRIAQLRHRSLSSILELIHQKTQDRQFGFMGEARVNVSDLNQALDQAHS